MIRYRPLAVVFLSLPLAVMPATSGRADNSSEAEAALGRALSLLKEHNFAGALADTERASTLLRGVVAKGCSECFAVEYLGTSTDSFGVLGNKYFQVLARAANRTSDKLVEHCFVTVRVYDKHDKLFGKTLLQFPNIGPGQTKDASHGSGLIEQDLSDVSRIEFEPEHVCDVQSPILVLPPTVTLAPSSSK